MISVFTYLVAIYWVVMLDGIHFSHGEGYCKPNDCDGNAVTDTLLEDTYIRCNRSLKSEKQKILFVKDMPKETTCQASEQGSVVQLILSTLERWDTKLWV